MNEKLFWKIIDMFNWDYEGDDDAVLQDAIEYLSARSKEDIVEFHEIMSRLLYNIDGIEYAKNIGAESYTDTTIFSVDYFLYIRCAVIANGKNYYYNVLKNPKEMPKDIDFESLLYISDMAYEIKEDEEFAHISKYSYETFSNKEKW